MRAIIVLTFCLGLALAGPADLKKLEKKSISNTLAPKSIEPVDQKLDEPKIGDEALLEAGATGESLERAKKQASTTFCVEIRQNKPNADCDDLKPQAPMAPQPAPAQAPSSFPDTPEPAAPPPPQQTQTYIQTRPQEINFQLPCEPEIGAFLVQPAGDIVYAPTGNCAQHPHSFHAGAGMPSSLPAGLPNYGLPGLSGLPSASGVPNIHVFQLPSAGFPGALHHRPIHVAPNTGLGGPSVIPLQPTGGVVPISSGPSVVPLQPASAPATYVIQPAAHPVHASHGLPVHGHGAPLHGVHATSGAGLPVHGHAPHQLTTTGIECTCKSAPQAVGRMAADSGSGAPSQSNEALAMKFLQDLQRNASPQPSSASGSPMTGSGMPMSGSAVPMSGSGMRMSGPTISMAPSGSFPMGASSGSPMMSVSMSDGSPDSFGKSAMSGMPGQYMQLIRPMPSMHQQPQMIFQQQPMHRSHVDCLQDSFHSGQMVQGLRLSRGPDEKDSPKEPEPEPKNEKPTAEAEEKKH